MELVEHTFAELSELKYRIYTTLLPNVLHREVLVIAFEAEYGYGCKGNGDAIFINAVITGARAAWASSFFVLDYRGLNYAWGDMLPVETGQKEMAAEKQRLLRAFGGVLECSATLISDRNREAMHRLLASDYGLGSDTSWMFDDLASALAAFENTWRQFQAERADLL